MDCSPPGSSVPFPWNSPGKNTAVSSHSLLQEIFLTQRSHPGLPHCRWMDSLSSTAPGKPSFIITIFKNLCGIMWSIRTQRQIKKYRCMQSGSGIGKLSEFQPILMLLYFYRGYSTFTIYRPLRK